MPQRDEQGVDESEMPTQADGAQTQPPAKKSGIAGLIQTVMGLRPVRVFLFFSNKQGSLLSSGLSYQAIFALFAALWFTFSIAGFVIKGNKGLQHTLVNGINGFIPNLIAFSAKDSGTIHLSSLLNTGALGISSVLSLLGVLFTAVGFLATLRSAIRLMFDLQGPKTSFVILKLKDLGLTVAFGLLVILTTVVSLVTTAATTAVLNAIGITSMSWFAIAVSWVVGFVVIALLDIGILAAAIRVLSGIPVPRNRLFAGALIGGIGLAFLQTVGSGLLGAPKNNPLFAAFATIFGLLVYFNFVCEVILLSAAWVAVGMHDANIDPRDLSPEDRETEQAHRLEEARRTVADADRRALENRAREAHGLSKVRLTRDLERMVRAEARRRERVPTEAEYKEHVDANDAGEAPPAKDAG